MDAFSLIFISAYALDLGGTGTLIAAMCSVLILAGTVARFIFKWVKNWRLGVKQETISDEKLKVTIYGQEADYPTPAIPGLVKDQESAFALLTAHTATIAQHTQELKDFGEDLVQVKKGLETLLARTETNGGSSLKDQINAICVALNIPVKEPNDAQRK